MIPAFLLAVRDALAPRQSRFLLLSIAVAVAAFAVLWLGATVFLHQAHLFGSVWLDAPLDVLGSLSALVLTWLLFPAAATFVLSFFLDRILAGLERQHYPDLPPPRVAAFSATVGSALRPLALTVVLNLLVLPLYLFPPVIPFVYYGLNGYLLGREYFELVALRRLDAAATRATWRGHRGRLALAGIVIAVLLSLPVVNLGAPLLAAALMLHLFEGLRRRGAPVTGSYRGGFYG